MRVKAHTTGSYRGHRRRPGEVFTIPDGATLPKWVEQVPDDTPIGKEPLRPAMPQQMTILDVIRQQEQQQTQRERAASDLNDLLDIPKGKEPKK